MEQTLTYVYAIIDYAEKRSFGRIGLSGNEVYTVPYRDISAVVSDVPIDNNSGSNPVEPTEENWLKHEQVIRYIMRKYTVLPIKFCSLLKNTHDLKQMLRRLYAECKAELKKFEDKVELGVKISLNEKNLKREVEEKRQEISRLRKDLLRERGLMMKRKVESLCEAVKRQLENIEEGQAIDPEECVLKIHYARELYEALRESAVESRANKLLSRDMILNGSFLVLKGKVEELKRNLDEIQRRHERRGFEILYSGPWAPYNFTKIQYY